MIAIVTIAVHLLVIQQIMPFTWINGGRSASFEIARQTSLISIVVLLIIIFISLWASQIIHISKFKNLLKVILWILFGYACLSIVMQFLGTTFEKCFTSILCILNAIVTFRLAIERR
jgi:fumarate reductase subunit D